jgi:hypothetical protein
MNKNLLIAALFAATSANAAMTITGDYEGTFTDGGAATYAQDLDLTLVGSTDGAKVTMMMEDITGGSTVVANQVFVEADLEGLSLKAGNYKSQNGSGLMQTTSAVVNQFEAGFSVAGAGITLGQTSGDGNATVDTSLEIAGLNVNVQNASATDRFITVVTNFFGFGTTVETQNTATGRNTALALDTSIAFDESTDVALTGVYMDVKDSVGVTQDDGILGDVSDASGTVKGAVASLNTSIGTVTGKYVVKNDLNTVTAELERGIWTLGHTKTEGTDGATTAKINVAF